jgi:hypothetical protein
MLENDHGTDFLPMRLAAALVAALIILTLVAACSRDIALQSSKAAARACADRIAAIAAAEYAEACPGSEGAQIDVTVPAIVRAMTFGAPSTEWLEEEKGRSYTIQFNDGSNESRFLGLPLGSGGQPFRGCPAVLYPGEYSVSIRVEAVDDRLMALIYAEAS